MVSSINGQSTLKLSADVIDIDGIVSSLSARSVYVGSLHSSGIFDVTVFNNQSVSWMSKTISGVTIYYLGHS